MIMDGHIHIDDSSENKDDFKNNLKKAGVLGGIIISICPESFEYIRKGVKSYTYMERLENLFLWKGKNKNLYPFYWIDPLEPNALEQVDLSETMGVMGYKVICSNHYPGDGRAMDIYKKIARAGKPILFHSGILWDGKSSSKYNRPSEFEALLEIDNLRFSLAHISWPWCDECIALYGKFQNATTIRTDLSTEMFIDLTPGTPPVYRENALKNLFYSGYDLENNIFFGSDCTTNNYGYEWVCSWIKRDNAIYEKLSMKDDVIKKIYILNLKRFVGVSNINVNHRNLLSAE